MRHSTFVRNRPALLLHGDAPRTPTGRCPKSGMALISSRLWFELAFRSMVHHLGNAVVSSVGMFPTGRRGYSSRQLIFNTLPIRSSGPDLAAPVHFPGGKTQRGRVKARVCPQKTCTQRVQIPRGSWHKKGDMLTLIIMIV